MGANEPCTGCCDAGYACQFGTCKQVTGDTSIAAYTFPAEMQANSKAPLISYYVYRAQPDKHYPLENVNPSNLPGVMWYLHNDIIASSYGRQATGITHIFRYKVWSKSTTPLYKLGMNYGALFAFNAGQCIGPYSCDEEWQKYGYVVGCKQMDFSKAYVNGVTFSFPGRCPQMTNEMKTSAAGKECKANQHGGHCSGTPTGQADCTYAYEDAGKISIDELTGYQSGDVEYNKATDKGTGMSFWDGINDPDKAAQRVTAAATLFEKQYPGTVANVTDPTEAAPKCDSNDDWFYGKTTPTPCKTALAGDACSQEIAWARSDGISAHPEWYPGLTATSSDNDFQMVCSKSGQSTEACSRPCIS